MVNQPKRIGRFPKCPMSAYSASPPVTTRKIDPSDRKPSMPLPKR